MKNRVHKLNENDNELLSVDKSEIHPFSSRPPRKIFEEVYHKSIQLGLKPEDFRHLSGIREIKKSVKRFHYVGFFCKTLCIAIIAALFIFVTEWPFSNTHILVWWFQWYNMNPLKEPCIAYVPEGIIESINPPIECGFCENVHQIDQIQNISRDNFEQKYAYTGRPVVISDGTKNWTATEIFSYSFIKGIFSPGSEALENVEKNCQFFPYKTEFSSLGKVFEMSEERATMKREAKPWYIGW